mmetsp:Transcript_10582/g.24918  ORF Transcript_10582/g.24918 Transcript_10582/m.24918 type:complete len:323 (-) Transcript_10582:144-1112(-)
MSPRSTLSERTKSRSLPSSSCRISATFGPEKYPCWAHWRICSVEKGPCTSLAWLRMRLQVCFALASRSSFSTIPSYDTPCISRNARSALMLIFGGSICGIASSSTKHLYSQTRPSSSFSSLSSILMRIWIFSRGSEKTLWYPLASSLFVASVIPSKSVPVFFSARIRLRAAATFSSGLSCSTRNLSKLCGSTSSSIASSSSPFRSGTFSFFPCAYLSATSSSHASRCDILNLSSMKCPPSKCPVSLSMSVLKGSMRIPLSSSYLRLSASSSLSSSCSQSSAAPSTALRSLPVFIEDSDLSTRCFFVSSSSSSSSSPNLSTSS